MQFHGLLTLGIPTTIIDQKKAQLVEVGGTAVSTAAGPQGVRLGLSIVETQCKDRHTNYLDTT